MAEVLQTPQDWDGHWQKLSAISPSADSDLVRWAVHRHGKLRGKITLEVGSGSGVYSAKIARLGALAFACDFSGVAVNLTKTTAEKEGVDVIVTMADGSSLPYLDSKFDLVFSEGLLHHVSPELQQQVLMEQIRVTKPRGVIIVDIPYGYRDVQNVLTGLESDRKIRFIDRYSWISKRPGFVTDGVGYIYRVIKPTF